VDLHLNIDEIELKKTPSPYFMSRSPRGILFGRRSTRLEEVSRRDVVHGISSFGRNPRSISASESEEDLVVVPNQGARMELSSERFMDPELDANPEEIREEIERGPMSISSEGKRSFDEAAPW